MNCVEATNEELSTFLDGPFHEDWTMEMPLESAMQPPDCLSLASIPNPIDYAFQPAPVGGPMDSSSGIYFSGVDHLEKSRYPGNTAVLNIYPEATVEDSHLASRFLTDPMLQSVPEGDPLLHATVLSVECDASCGLEFDENAFHRSRRFVEYANHAISNSSCMPPYPLESGSSLLPSKTNESDSNCSHESNFQTSDSFFNSPDPCQETRVPKTVFPSTVVRPVLGRRKMLEPSLLDSSQYQIKVEHDCPMIQNTAVLSPGMMLAQPLPFQTTPQMKLPSLPKTPLVGGPSSMILPVEFANNAVDWNRTNGVLLDRPQEQNSCSTAKVTPLSNNGVCSNPARAGKGSFNPVQSLGYRDLHTTQSTSNLSCISTNTTGESTLSGGRAFDNKSSSKKSNVNKLTPEERQLKILRYKQKRTNRRFNRGVTYQCRKTLADSRPRVRGRFAKNDDIHAIPPPSKKSASKNSIKR